MPLALPIDSFPNFLGHTSVLVDFKRVGGDSCALTHLLIINMSHTFDDLEHLEIFFHLIS